MKSPRSTGRRFLLTPLALSASLFLAACGGGGDSADSTAAAAAAPVIAAQPADQSVAGGKVATFSVTASGNALAYQWQSSKDGGTTWVAISGATTASLTVSSTDATLNGTKYRVVITGGGQSVTSSPVTLTVTATIAAPVISVDVAAVAVTAGADAVFAVTANGSTLAYQWQVSTDGTTFTNVAGATGATLTLPAVASTDSGKTVRVAVTNSAGTVNSTAAALYVTPAVVDATLLAQPADASATAPSPVTFSVAAAGAPAPTYQWQKSVDGGTTWVDVAGATAASYTTPATALADSGSLFRVSATNATATVVSAPAKLTVSAAPVAVAITTQPAALSVTVPSTATFSIVATGSPTPTYQWQVKGTAAGSTFANITGATSPSYTTPATVAADSGKQYQVVVTNGSGSVTSAAAMLTATAATTVSKLAGRAWTTGVALETGDASVGTPNAGIDDAGNAISVFTKSDGTRSVLYATRGVPGVAGTAPVWSAPVLIDSVSAPAASTATGSAYARQLTVAPNGNAVVIWRSTAPCTAATYNTSGTCNFLYAARYVASSGSWTVPAQVVDTPTPLGNPIQTQLLNSSGDLAILYTGWVRSGTSYTSKPAVVWQASGQTAIQKRVFSDVSLGNIDIGMDKNGNLLLAGEATLNSTTDLVAYRGTTVNGFGSQEVLEQRTSAVTFDKLTVGSNGQAVVTWYQNNGTATTRFAANLATPTAAWSVNDISNSYNVDGTLYVTDSGDAILGSPCFVGTRGAFKKLSAGVWSDWQTYPVGLRTCGQFNRSNRNGDLLIFDSSNWMTYDAASNSVVRAITSSATTLYGTTGGSLGNSDAALSVNGIGALSTSVAYDTLPTVAQPAGDGRSAVKNLWGLFLK